LGIDSSSGRFSNASRGGISVARKSLGLAAAAHVVKGSIMNTKYRVDRRKALGLMGGVATLVAVPGARAFAQSLDKVSYQTNWRAQAEHGGFYLARENGIYKKHGIDADIRMGGPQQNPSQLLLGGRVDMIMSNSFEGINYAKENLPFLVIASIFQKDPQVIISHPGVGHDSFEQLKGKPILIGAGGRNSYWPFLKVRFGYTEEQARPYTFNMAPFLADKNLSQQGFVSSEPYVIMQAGVQPVVHLIADAGFDNYNTTINISRKMVDEKREVVQRFVNATLEGWAEYMKGGPGNDAANAAIKKDNPDMTDDKIAYALKVMNERGIVKSGDALKLGIGAMTDERWKRFYETMTAAGAFAPGIDYRRAYSLEFINKGVGA
jgi:NitT/TauT family transport system substrate-binding protein